ncbi:MAG: hypothetical protein IKO86_06040 [Prevotella sp.]|nr:hypothetical protein [Prevotella sp.]
MDGLLENVPEATTAQSLRYWFNDNSGTNIQTSDVLDGSAIEVNASALVDGIHVLHYQIVDSEGKVYVPVSKLFIKAGATPTTEKLRYWFDDEKTQVVEKDYSNSVQVVDASGIIEGIHTLHYQIVDNNGTAGIPVSKMFMKLGVQTVTATAILYWFDENDANIKESPIDLDNLTTTVDASSLILGKHVLNYQLKLSDGTLSPAATATFETTQTLEGDANNDQKVNVADIVVIQIFMGDNTKPIHGANADVNKDQVIDEKDVEAVKDIIIPPVE